MRHIARSLVASLVLALTAVPAFAGDTYKVDPVHASLVFRAKHMNIGVVYGRFNAIAGQFTLDEADKWDKLWSELFLGGAKVKKEGE